MAAYWSGKVVVVTGASSGIGRALAVEIGRRGAKVGLIARRVDLLCEAVSEIEEAGGRALASAGDVSDVNSTQAAIEQVRKTLGPIDVLVANAGMSHTTKATKLRISDVTDIIKVNLIGAINSVGAVLPEMLERRAGHLVAISSLAAYRGLPGSAGYSASKAALSTFFESLRVDLRGSGVDVTTIHPGFIKTPMTEKRSARMPFLLELDEGVRHILGAIEERRSSYAFPWQLASVVRFLTFLPDSLYDRLMARVNFRE